MNRKNNIGIIGGIGPESTIEYYRSIIKTYQERLSTTSYPEFLLHSIDMSKMLDFVYKDDLKGLVEFLIVRINVLKNANIECVALASNTPHLVFEELQDSVEVKLISIVEEACKRINICGLKRVALLGTKSTMSRGFYQKVGAKNDLEIISPSESDQDFIHRIYMDELVFNRIIPTTKQKLIQIIDEMNRTENINGVILGGTELPLILDNNDFKDLEVFNTTNIHVEAIVDCMLASRNSILNY